MQYEVREILKGRKLVAYGVFPTSAPLYGKQAAPVQEFEVGKGYPARIAHHLALIACHDRNDGIE